MLCLKTNIFDQLQFNKELLYLEKMGERRYRQPFRIEYSDKEAMRKLRLKKDQEANLKEEKTTKNK